MRGVADVDGAVAERCPKSAQIQEGYLKVPPAAGEVDVGPIPNETEMFPFSAF